MQSGIVPDDQQGALNDLDNQIVEALESCSQEQFTSLLHQLIEATVEAAHLRFRPILMTGFAFVFGVAPMVIASGASGKSQQALGTGVMGGMIAVVVLALLMVPVFFVAVQKLFARREREDSVSIVAPQVEAADTPQLR